MYKLRGYIIHKDGSCSYKEENIVLKTLRDFSIKSQNLVWKELK